MRLRFNAAGHALYCDWKISVHVCSHDTHSTQHVFVSDGCPAVRADVDDGVGPVFIYRNVLESGTPFNIWYSMDDSPSPQERATLKVLQMPFLKSVAAIAFPMRLDGISATLFPSDYPSAMRFRVAIQSLLDLAVTAAGIFLFAHAAGAQGSVTGAIEGRVYDAGRGEYLERARLTLQGTALEAFTDAGGEFRFTGVPTGMLRLEVFFTGLATQTLPVNVAAGQTTVANVTLSASAGPPADAKDVVRLANFVVSTSKEMDGAAIAINEQRFAADMKKVVAADEFGSIVDGTPGELLKFLPGVSMDYSAGEARLVNINGVPPSSVPITVGGFELASAGGAGMSRNVQLDQVSINSMSRIELSYSPTPETPGSALAGAINLVPRSAFERSRPVLNYSLFLTMKSTDRSLDRTYDPLFGQSRKITPAVNFSAVVPVNKRFGFTLSGNRNNQYTPLDFAQNTWKGANSATTGLVVSATANQYPDTTPDQPYLGNYTIRRFVRWNYGDSVAGTADFKLSRNDTVSFSYNYSSVDVKNTNRNVTLNTNRVLPGDFSPSFTRGQAGRGSLAMTSTNEDWYGHTDAVSLVYRHNGAVWQAEAGAGYGYAPLYVKNEPMSTFGAVNLQRSGVTVGFDQPGFARPARITVTDAAGPAIDPFDARSYTLGTSVLSKTETYDKRSKIYANLKRDLLLGRVPLQIKGGFDVSRQSRDDKALTKTYTFIGADGRATTTPTDPLGSDDGAAIVLDEGSAAARPVHGFGPVVYPSGFELYQLYKAHPEYFQLNETALYNNRVNTSRIATETIASAYLRFDAAFFERRLNLTSGLRAEQTNDVGIGRLNDPTGNFQRDASGRFILGANGRPLTILPTTDTLGVAKLTNIERGLRAEKEYLRLFPSLNANYKLRENLIARAAYYLSVGRPPFNQYAGGITLPDVTLGPVATNPLTVSNAGIKAWSAKTFKVRLEYYFEKVGAFSLGAFRRDIRDFFGSIVIPATPDFLALYGLEPSTYAGFSVATQYNIPSVVRTQGLEFDYKQSLTFLPHWGRGLTVFANGSTTQMSGENKESLNGFAPYTVSAGGTLARERYKVVASWNLKARARGVALAGRSIGPETYNWAVERNSVDLTVEYNLRRSYTLFATVRNLANYVENNLIYGPQTPAANRLNIQRDYRQSWVLGVRGSF